MSNQKLKILNWNVGVFQPLTYLKFFGMKLQNHYIEHEFFYKHNGSFISEYITSQNPDVVILQEILSLDDVQSIPVLEKYPYKKLLPMWGDNNILLATKEPFHAKQIGSIFFITTYAGINIIPLHLNSFSSQKRLAEVSELVNLVKEPSLENVLAIGDTNLWERNKYFLFSKDKQAYNMLTEIIPEIPTGTSSTHRLGGHIDKVFFKSNDTNNNTVTAHCQHKTGLFMDHYPVVVEVG